MIRELVSAAPLVALAVSIGGAAIVAAPAGWFARTAVYECCEKPGLIRAEQEKAAAIADAAAARATQAERDRQFQIGEEAWRAAERQRGDDEAFHEAQLRLLRERIREYAQRCTEGSCGRALSELDVQFLDGVPGQQDGPAGGRR